MIRHKAPRNASFNAARQQKVCNLIHIALVTCFADQHVKGAGAQQPFLSDTESVTEALMCCTQAWFLAEKYQLMARKPICHCMGQISGHLRCTCMFHLQNMPLMPCLFSSACRSSVHHVHPASEGLLAENVCCRGFCQGTRLPCRLTWMPYVAWQIACSPSLP